MPDPALTAEYYRVKDGNARAIARIDRKYGRSPRKPQTNEQWLRSLYVSGRIDVEEFEARVAYHLEMGSLDSTAPVPIAPPSWLPDTAGMLKAFQRAKQEAKRRPCPDCSPCDFSCRDAHA